MTLNEILKEIEAFSTGKGAPCFPQWSEDKIKQRMALLCAYAAVGIDEYCRGDLDETDETVLIPLVVRMSEPP